MVPGDVSIQFNFRHSTECTPDQLKNDVEIVVKKHADNYELNWAIPSEPYLTPKDLTNILTSAISDITGVNPEATTTGGTSDGRFIAKSVNRLLSSVQSMPQSTK